MPELSIDLLLEHFLLDGTALVNQLLLSLDSRSKVVELGIFLAEGIVLGLKFGVLTASDLIGAFLFALTLKGL